MTFDIIPQLNAVVCHNRRRAWRGPFQNLFSNLWITGGYLSSFSHGCVPTRHVIPLTLQVVSDQTHSAASAYSVAIWANAARPMCSAYAGGIASHTSRVSLIHHTPISLAARRRQAIECFPPWMLINGRSAVGR